jgi:hypothetical protein
MPLTAPTTLSRTLLLAGTDDPSQAILVEVDAVEDLVRLDGEGVHPGLQLDGHAWLGALHSLGESSVQVLQLALLRQHPQWIALTREAPKA